MSVSSFNSSSLSTYSDINEADEHDQRERVEGQRLRLNYFEGTPDTQLRNRKRLGTALSSFAKSIGLDVEHIILSPHNPDDNYRAKVAVLPYKITKDFKAF